MIALNHAKFETTHMSMVSDNRLKALGDQFISEYKIKAVNPIKKDKKTIRWEQKMKYNLGATPNLDDNVSCSTVKLKDCVVCMSETSDGVIMPCGHGGLCYECALQLL